MKIEKLVKISEEDKKTAIDFFQNMNDGKGILVVNNIPAVQEYKSVDGLVELYSKDNLFIGCVSDFHQNRYMKAGRKELIIEKGVNPTSSDLVVIENGMEVYAKKFKELDNEEKNLIVGIVLEECIWLNDD